MRTNRLGIERLEDRSVPATFGIPWADRHLTLSFAPDGTSVSGDASNLFDSLNLLHSEPEWQREILRAYQTWANHTNLSVAVIADSGDAIGAPGRWQGDERFGDLRIAGVNLNSNVLAIGTAADPGLAGTRAGDVILNTAYRFDGRPYDLYSVMLHEAGHSLGVGNSPNPNAVMFTQYSGLRTGLHSSDVTAVQALYGVRTADQFEGTHGNNTTGRASDLGGVLTRDTIQLAFGDLTTATDRDVYSFLTTGPSGNDNQNVTVKIQSAGLSLVNAKLTVFFRDASGAEVEVGNATMNPDGFTGGKASVAFDANDDSGPRRYYVRVEKADGTTFHIGKYALGVSFQDDEGFEQTDLLDVPNGPRPVLLNADGNRNNARQTATALAPMSVSSILPNSRYEVLASLSTATDTDYYRVVAPTGSSPRVLTVNTQALSGQASAPTIRLLDATGNVLTAGVLSNDHGLLTIQAEGLTAGAAYFVRVTGGEAGNYRLTADFGTRATDVRTFVQGVIPTGADSAADTLYIGQAQVMQWLVSASAANAPAGTGVRMEVLDANGSQVFVAFARAGETVSGPGVLLRPGQYTVRMTTVRTDGYTGPVSVSIRGNTITDPVGAQTQDPTFRPTYTDPYNPNQFIYPGDIVSIDPFYWFSMLIR